MEIRTMNESDYPRLYALWIKNNISTEIPNDYEWIVKFLKKNPQTCLLLLENDVVIGSLLAGFDGYQCTIHQILIDISYRRLGYGSKLLKHLKELCKTMNCRKLTISTYTSNDVFRKFMKYNSFIQREDIAGYIHTFVS